MAPPPKDRIGKSALAARLKVSRETIYKYLGMVGAPAPDPHGKYAVEEMISFMAEHSSVGVVGDDEEERDGKNIQYYKREEVKLRCQKMKDDIARARGEYVSKAEASRTIIPLMAELGELMRQKFILELPSRYRGHDQIECQAINEKAVDEITKRFREGASELIIED